MSFKIEVVSSGRTITAENGENLRDVLAGAGFYFPQSCGGKGTCGRCRVDYIENAPEIYKRESELLGDTPITRLACLHKVDSSAKIFLPPIQEFNIQKTVAGFSIEGGSAGYGIAVDLGTTTIAVYLVNLNNGEVTAQAGMINPQVNLGADVMTRLELAKNESGRLKLTDSVNNGLKEVIPRLLLSAGIPSREINSLIIAGNSAMTHLLHGHGGEGLERAPFKSLFEGRGFVLWPAEDAGLGEITLAETCPVISGFIGGDTTAAIIAAELDIIEKRCLLVDFGTNGELVLSNRGKLTATSTAAGPAFEGVGMKFGMPAIAGAIEAASPSGRPEVIGNGEPCGICGSGYISTIAYLLKIGKLNVSGLLEKDADGIRQWSFDENNDTSPAINQEDIRKFQLAKGAIAAGSEILLDEALLVMEDIDEVIITGSFGNRIDAAAGMEIGLLPAISPEKIRYIDNAAGRGACLCLGAGDYKKRAECLHRTVTSVNLGEHPGFQEAFIRNMALQQ